MSGRALTALARGVDQIEGEPFVSASGKVCLCCKGDQLLGPPGRRGKSANGSVQGPSNSGLDTTQEPDGITVISWSCQFLSVVHRSILLDHYPALRPSDEDREVAVERRTPKSILGTQGAAHHRARVGIAGLQAVVRGPHGCI